MLKWWKWFFRLLNPCNERWEEKGVKIISLHNFNIDPVFFVFYFLPAHRYFLCTYRPTSNTSRRGRREGRKEKRRREERRKEGEEEERGERRKEKRRIEERGGRRRGRRE